MSPAVKVDAACAAAVDVARAALLDGTAADEVGDHLGVAAEASEGARLVTHQFACRHPGYRGWTWAVTVARVPRSRTVTVSEAVLLPGPDAVLAPPWVPYRERLRPGDVGPGDVVVTDPDDDRLLPGYAAVAAEDAAEPGGVAAVAAELGLGRARVLSPEGRDDAAERWYAGAAGPAAPEARTAPEPCATCGFFLCLAGPLGAAFGVCSNAMSPSDGHVVSVDHGCGAHSEIAVLAAMRAPTRPVLDTLGHDQLGHDQLGHDQLGHDQTGHDQTGHDQLGGDQPGHDQLGHDQTGGASSPPAAPTAPTDDVASGPADGPAT